MTKEIPDFHRTTSPEVSNIRDIPDEEWIKYVTLLKTVDSGSKMFRHFMLRDDARSSPCGSLYDELSHNLRIAQIMNTQDLSQLKNLPLVAEYFFQETPLFVQVELIDKFPQGLINLFR